MAEFMSRETNMLREAMVCQDLIQTKKIRINCHFHVDFEVSIDQGGVLEGTSKGRKNLKIYEELARFRLH